MTIYEARVCIVVLTIVVTVVMMYENDGKPARTYNAMAIID